MRNFAAGLMATALVGFPIAALAQPMYNMGNRPVMLTANAEGLDPCSLGVIVDEQGETSEDGGAIMVFPGDSTDLDYVDSLSNGDAVWICEVSDEMVGVVYSSDSELDCEVSSPVDEDRPYLGPCNWGWVVSNWVSVAAG